MLDKVLWLVFITLNGNFFFRFVVLPDEQIMILFAFEESREVTPVFIVSKCKKPREAYTGSDTQAQNMYFYKK